MPEYQERPEADEYDDFYAGYVARVPPGDLVEILETQIDETHDLVEGLSDAEADYAYAPGKWTVKEVLGHLADSERVLAYRALRFARTDATDLPGFDENAWVPPGSFGDRTPESLAEELRSVRAASVHLFRGLPAEAWTRTGTANGAPVSVRALACIIAGHELQHRSTLVERYGLGAGSGG